MKHHFRFKEIETGNNIMYCCQCGLSYKYNGYRWNMIPFMEDEKPGHCSDEAPLTDDEASQLDMQRQAILDRARNALMQSGHVSGDAISDVLCQGLEDVIILARDGVPLYMTDEQIKRLCGKMPKEEAE